jgi:predicted enzyme related to lactoylglutathione lyase
MDKVQHFEIPTDDLSRAKKFYQNVFGWKLVDFPNMDYTIAYTVEVNEQNMPKEPGSINGGMMKRDATAPSPVVVVTVDSIKDSLAKIKAAGGTIVMETWQVGDMGLYARIKDTEGNVIGVWENLKTPHK